jgi:hypothetical protein
VPEPPAPGVVPHHLRWCPWGCTLSCCRGLLDFSSCRRPPGARNEVSTDNHHVNATRLVDEKSHGPGIRSEPGHPSACRASQASDHRDVSRKPILVTRVSRDPSTCSSRSRKPWWSCWRPGSPNITRPSLLVFRCSGLARVLRCRALPVIPCPGRARDKHDQDEELSCALFYHTVQHNLRWITRRVLECKPDLLNNNFRGYSTPRLIATLANNPEIVRDILDLGVDISTQHPPRYLPEITAFGPRSNRREDSHDTYDMFLKYTSDLPERNITARAGTPFEYIIHVVSMYAPDVVPDLLKRGSDPNLRAGDGSTPIHYAIMGNSLEAVQILVEADADINAESYSGRTAFHIAVSLRSNKILKYLLDNGASTGHQFPQDAFVGITIEIPTTPRGAGTYIPDRWIRTDASASSMAGTQQRHFLTKEPYVSIAVKHRSLKRIVFKLQTYKSGGGYAPLYLFRH